MHVPNAAMQGTGSCLRRASGVCRGSPGVCLEGQGVPGVWRGAV